ncbi:MAG: InlB B-repeat-containing protein [Bacteroidales bacterium]|nr:InlB B-repeat-containing protein [Bacteroidales bacterium]
MKKILTFLFALCLGFCAMAQDVILYDFNDSTQFEDWTVIDNPEDTIGGYNWRYDDEMGVVYSIVNLGNTPDFRIESPNFDVADFDISATFLFAMGSYSSSRTARASISVYVIIDDREYPRLQYNMVDSIGWVWYCDTIANLVDLGILDLDTNSTFRVAIEFNSVSNSNALVMIDDFKFHMRDDVALFHFVGPIDGGSMDDAVLDTGAYFYAPAPEYDFPDGTVFLFWYVEDMHDSVYLLDEGDSIWISGDMIWYAQWGYEYTVSYSANDGTNSTPDVEDAIQYLGHEVLDWSYTRDHYIFSGYNTEADGSGTHYDIGDTLDLETDYSGAVITTDVWLYAQWTPITVKVHYDANGGIGTMMDTVIVEESDFDVVKCLFYRTGYAFDHWNTMPDGSGIDYEVGETINPDADVTLYAQWVTTPTITISFVFGEASGSLPDTVVNAGYDFVIPDYSLVFYAHSFVGWKDVANDTIYYVGDTINYAADLTLTAIWETVPMVTVSFGADAADAHGSMNTVYYPAADNYTIPACAFSRYGYAFEGWYEASADTVYNVGDVVLWAEGSYTLTARWSAVPMITIVFSANYLDAVGAMSDIHVFVDSLFTLPDCLFDLSGYTFAGWNTQADGRGTAYAERQQVSFSTDTVLYAQWNVIPVTYYTISFNANGGTGDMSPIRIENGRVFRLPACTFVREGYTFAGWGTNPHGYGEVFSVGAELYVGQPRIFYALWTSNEPEGIAITAISGLTVGPNPATTMVSVGGVSVERLTIIDIYGHTLRTVKAQPSVSFADLPSGIYTLRIEAAEGTALRRIVKK